MEFLRVLRPRKSMIFDGRTKFSISWSSKKSMIFSDAKHFMFERPKRYQNFVLMPAKTRGFCGRGNKFPPAQKMLRIFLSYAFEAVEKSLIFRAAKIKNFCRVCKIRNFATPKIYDFRWF
jgi:hypothetical protein